MALTYFKLALPYLGAVAIAAAYGFGYVDESTAALLAAALAIPSPLAHAAEAVGSAVKAAREKKTP